jgi:alpha-L-rhamnosidase
MNSFSHYSFGAVCEWMFRTLAGIDSDGPGYSKIIIRPTPPSPGSNAQHGPIDWVDASYRSIRGKIASRWKVQGNRFHLEVEIPANTTATVFVPAASADSVTEGGGPLSDAEHVQVIGMRRDRLVLSIESGCYRFESTGGIQPAQQALKTSAPADFSQNPENIDLSLARQLVQWDFGKDPDVARWTTWHNLKIDKRGDKVFLISTGGDPQMATQFDDPLAGPLAIELKARPRKAVQAQFFWASPTGGFNARQQNGRQLNPASQLNSYLFRVGDDQPLKKLRFDPFANQGEMEVHSLTVYALEKETD